MNHQLSHLNATGQASMVDVAEKAITPREATAECELWLPEEIVQEFPNNSQANQEIMSKKGPVLHTARLAGIQAVKRCAELIPLCHPLPLDHIDLQIDRSAEDLLRIRCSVKCTAKTGVEMEALTGASVAALTLYDMLKALSHRMTIRQTRVVQKSGGKEDFDAR